MEMVHIQPWLQRKLHLTSNLVFSFIQLVIIFWNITLEQTKLDTKLWWEILCHFLCFYFCLLKLSGSSCLNVFTVLVNISWLNLVK